MSGLCCFGQKAIRFAKTTDLEIQIGENYSDITVKTSVPNDNFIVQISDTTVASIEKPQYATDANSQINISVYGKNYGKAEIIVCTATDTIRRSIAVVPKNNDYKTTFFELTETIASLKSAINELNVIPQNQEGIPVAVSDSKGEFWGRPKYQMISYALMVITSVLLVFLFVFSKKINKKNRDIADLKERKAYYKSEFNTQKDLLLRERDSFTSEIEKHKRTNVRLQNELNQILQNQQSDEEQITQPVQRLEPQPQSLYADAIIDGKFNCVKEYPDDNTIFELKLNNVGDIRAGVIVYKAAEQLVTKRPEFLDGCEKQILGSAEVTMLNEGVAHRDSNGYWIITAIPEVKIS